MTAPTKRAVIKSFRLFDFHVQDVAVDENRRRFTIQMFGINERGETVSFIIEDFKPFFYIHVAASTWGGYEVDCVEREFRKRASSARCEICRARKLYGFSAGALDTFIKCTVGSMSDFRRLTALWYKYNAAGKRIDVPYSFHNTPLKLYETKIPPLLRYFHIHNLSPSGWVAARVSSMTRPSQPTTTCKYEFITSQQWITPLPDKETLVPFKICSFDIEASSSHGDFPVPKKTYKRLANQLADVVDQGETAVARAIARAFDPAADNEDRVYPKEPLPTRAEIDVRIQRLLQHKTTDPVEQKQVLTIETQFLKMRMRDEDDSSDCDSEPPQRPAAAAAADTNIIEYWKHLAREARVFDINRLLTHYFPELEGDQVTFIGSTFLLYGNPLPYRNHCLVVGTCNPLPDMDIQTCATESEMLLAWSQLIQSENPDIIIGYNIFGFDYEFMYCRAQENNIENEVFSPLSRLLSSADEETAEAVELKQTKIQLASGEYELNYPATEGRLQIDLYTYFRREFNLASYKLDFVASEYINDTITRVEHTDHQTLLYTNNITGLQLHDYIHIELVQFSNDYLCDGAKFEVQTICPAAHGCALGIARLDAAAAAQLDAAQSTKTIKWGLAKDDVSPQDIFRLSRGSATDRSRVAKYCIQDCNIVHHLMRKIDLLVGFTEMSRICSVPMSFLVFRGQGIKLTSFLAKKCREKNTLMPDLPTADAAAEGDDDGYEGAIVLAPKCGIYLNNPVACLDYSSLYPSNMISQNFSHDSKVWAREYDLDGRFINAGDPEAASLHDNIPGIEYVDVVFDTFKYVRKTPKGKAVKVKCGHRHVRWAQTTPAGILPSILMELLQARKATRKCAEKETDAFMKNILDKRQNAYKITANSLYGQCGSKTSTFYEKDIAASTTAVGRKMITYARRMIEELYKARLCTTTTGEQVETHAEYIYGDTDSVFFTFHLQDPTTHDKIVGKRALAITIDLAQQAARLCTMFLKPPMELSYEKTQMPFILLSKKRYVSMLYETNPNKGKLKFMGLSLKRRDACDYLKDVYGGLLSLLMSPVEDKAAIIQKCIAFLKSALNDLIEGHVPLHKLTLTKALRSYYKKPETIGHKVLADRIRERDPGNAPKSGDRIQFAFIRNEQNPRALVGDRIETLPYITSRRLPLDYDYYITNQLMKPLQQLLGLALEDILVLVYKRETAARRFQKQMAQLLKECAGDLELFMKQREKETAKEIKKLVFDEFLVKIHQKSHKMRPIEDFYRPAAAAGT
jgi:DNA polymerase elongation subunit (family B)